MTMTLTKLGDGYALVIHQPLLDQIGATPQTAFEVASEGGSLVLTPVRQAADQEKFEQAVAMVHARFGNAMRRLAE